MNKNGDRLPLVTKIVSAIKAVTGEGPVALHEPLFWGNEWLYLKECLDSTFVSSVGKFVDRFEADIAEFTGAKYAVAMVNGTSALHIALKLAGVQPEDEVLVPALTFVATANAVTYCGAHPHFVDSEEKTLGVDPDKLRSYLDEIADVRGGCCVNRQTERVIRALVPMHTFGHPVNLEGVISVARDFQMALVEDAAESLGSYYQGRHTGTFGLMGILSFNGNKIVTTGGGGAILTNDRELARRAKHLTTTAKMPHPWEYQHDEIGYNYRLPNLNAALGCAQLERLPDMLRAKRELFKKYKEAFADIKEVSIIQEPDQCESNYWLQTLLLEDGYASLREELLEASHEQGVMTRPVWKPLSEILPFRGCPKMDLSFVQEIAGSIINLPSSSNLTSRCK